MANETQQGDTQQLNDFLGTPPRPWWRRYLKWIAIGVGALLLIWLLFAMFGSSTKTEYATQDVTKGNLTVTVSATGKLAPTNQVQVGSELSGLVETVLVDVNDRVVKGQALAVLDTSRLDDSITQSQAALAAAQATVAQNQATLAEANATLSRLEEVYKLSGGKVPAKTEMDSARAAAARGVANVRAAQANVVSQRAALRSNETQRYKAVIRSPVNGVVLARQVDAGQTVAASFNVATLFVIAEDLSQMELQVAIDEADVGEVQQGQSATFTVDAFPGRTFPATITRVDLGSNLSASAASSSSTTASTSATVVSYAATLSVANPDQKLRPGMTATAVITTNSRPDVLLVPNAALRYKPTTQTASSSSGGGITSALAPPRGRRGGGGGGEKSATLDRGAKQTVYVLDGEGKPQPIEVTTGDTNGSMTEVTGGKLTPSMKVITGQMASGSTTKSGSGGGQRRQGGSGGGQRSGGQ
jgi:HlyD family secretion protein